MIIMKKQKIKIALQNIWNEIKYGFKIHVLISMKYFVRILRIKMCRSNKELSHLMIEYKLEDDLRDIARRIR